MIKFLQKTRQNMLSEGKISKYANGEIILGGLWATKFFLLSIAEYNSKQFVYFQC